MRDTVSFLLGKAGPLYTVYMPLRPFDAIAKLPRDAMHITFFAIVRLSFCLSVTLVYCVELAKLTIKLFSSPGGPIILFFPQEI